MTHDTPSWWTSLSRCSSVREVLKVLQRSHLPSIGFSHAPGNSGDALLAHASHTLLTAYSLPWHTLYPPESPFLSAAAEDKLETMPLAIFGGGGSFVPGNESCVSFIRHHTAQGRHVIILPQTVRGYEEFLATLPSTVLIICRESHSLAHVRKHAKSGGAMSFQDHDMVLLSLLSHYTGGASSSSSSNSSSSSHCSSGTPHSHPSAPLSLWCFNGGPAAASLAGAPPTPTGPTVVEEDLPAGFACTSLTPRDALDAEAQRFLASLSRFSTIHTNRLHVALGAAVLSAHASPPPTIVLYDTPCGKNSAVFDASRALLPGVILGGGGGAAVTADSGGGVFGDGLPGQLPLRLPLLLLFSDTRNARESASWVAWEATKRGIPHILAPLSTTIPIPSATSTSTSTLLPLCDALPLAHAGVVFFVSTWGDGEFPAPSLGAWKALLSASLPLKTWLPNTPTTVFALGDSVYPKYNAAGRKLWARLVGQLGSPPLHPRCLADWQAQGGYPGALEAWVNGGGGGEGGGGLWDSLAALHPPSPSNGGRNHLSAALMVLAPRFTVREIGETPGISSPSPFPSHPHAPHLRAWEAALPLPWPYFSGMGLEGEVGTGCVTLDTTAAATVGAAAPKTSDSVPWNGAWYPLSKGVHESGGGDSGSGSGDESDTMPQPYIARVMANSRLTREGWSQDVRNIVLSQWEEVVNPTTTTTTTTTTAPTWVAGDVAMIYPENPLPYVQSFAAWLGLDLDSTLLEILPLGAGGGDTTATLACSSSSSSVSSPKFTPPAWALESQCGFARPPPLPPSTFPPTLSLHTLLTRYLDITSVPSRWALGHLAPYARSSAERGKLEELASPRGAGLYGEYCVGEGRGWGEVLGDFPSLKPLPLPLLLELIPRVKPRHFSAASSPGGGGEGPSSAPHLHLCVARVQRRTRYGRVVKGLASNWLCDAVEGQRVVVWMRQGGARRFFHRGGGGGGGITGATTLPPLILIGPGTGIAPMRAAIQECAAEHATLCSSRSRSSDGKGKGDDPPPPRRVLLFTGYRHALEDHLYGDEMEGKRGESQTYRRASSSSSSLWGGLDEYHPAFSRDTPPKRVYCHALMRARGVEVRRLLVEEGACVFVAGSATSGLPEDCRKTLVGILGGEGEGGGGGGGEAALAELERAGRLVVEAW